MHRMAPVHKTEKPTLAPLSLNSFWKYGLAAARSTLWHLTVWPVAQVRLTSTRLEWSCKRVNTALKCGLCPFHARVVNPLVDRSMISATSQNPLLLRFFRDFSKSHTSAPASCWPPTDQWPSPLLVFAVTGAARLFAAAGGLKHLRVVPVRAPTGAPRGRTRLTGAPTLVSPEPANFPHLYRPLFAPFFWPRFRSGSNLGGGIESTVGRLDDLRDQWWWWLCTHPLAFSPTATAAAHCTAVTTLMTADCSTQSKQRMVPRDLDPISFDPKMLPNGVNALAALNDAWSAEMGERLPVTLERQTIPYNLCRSSGNTMRARLGRMCPRRAPRETRGDKERGKWDAVSCQKGNLSLGS